MKHCFKWMIACVLIALTLTIILPKFGVAAAGASLLIPLLMIGCCVLPLLIMVGSKKESGSCCSKKDDQRHRESDAKTNADGVKPSSGSCH
jgi:hypothetical protein